MRFGTTRGMPMNEFLSSGDGGGSGRVCSGRFFLAVFGGRSAEEFPSERPALWFFGSLLLRMSITLTGFYFVGQEYWERWLLCLLGFVLARLVVGWLTRLSAADQPRPAQGASYAP